MISDVTKHKLDYSLLAGLAIAYLVFVMRFKSSPQTLVIATAIFGLLYLVWGIIHHLRSGSFAFKIVLEYFLVATLSTIIMATLLI